MSDKRVHPVPASIEKVPPAKKQYQQKFADAWLKVPDFKPWLMKKWAEDGSYEPFCKICRTGVGCHKTALMRHLSSKHHVEAAKMEADLQKSQPTVHDAFIGLDRKAAAMEIKTSAFIAENNLPISLCEPLIDLMKDLFPSDAALKKSHIGKTKVH